MYLLVSGRTKIQVDTSRTIGRADFPEHNVLSRKHFEIQIKNGRVHVCDLGSTNGTFLNGGKLEPGISIQIREEDIIAVGSIEFRLVQQKARVGLPKKVFMDAAIFCGFFALVLIDPSMALGRALGSIGLIIVVSMIVLPLLVSSTVFDLLILRRLAHPRKLLIYAALVLLSTAGLKFGLIKVLDSQTDVVDYLTEQKIRHFCLDKFDGDQCVAQINFCPICPQHLSIPDRTTIGMRLAERFHLSNPAQRLPAVAKPSH
jgi:hypothetical protein